MGGRAGLVVLDAACDLTPRRHGRLGAWTSPGAHPDTGPVYWWRRPPAVCPGLLLHLPLQVSVCPWHGPVP